jgi:hypothetical protein
VLPPLTRGAAVLQMFRFATSQFSQTDCFHSLLRYTHCTILHLSYVYSFPYLFCPSYTFIVSISQSDPLSNEYIVVISSSTVYMCQECRLPVRTFSVSFPYTPHTYITTHSTYIFTWSTSHSSTQTMIVMCHVLYLEDFNGQIGFPHLSSV